MKQGGVDHVLSAYILSHLHVTNHESKLGEMGWLGWEPVRESESAAAGRGGGELRKPGRGEKGLSLYPAAAAAERGGPEVAAPRQAAAAAGKPAAAAAAEEGSGGAGKTRPGGSSWAWSGSTPPPARSAALSAAAAAAVSLEPAGRAVVLAQKKEPLRFCASGSDGTVGSARLPNVNGRCAARGRRGGGSLGVGAVLPPPGCCSHRPGWLVPGQAATVVAVAPWRDLLRLQADSSSQRKDAGLGRKSSPGKEGRREARIHSSPPPSLCNAPAPTTTRSRGRWCLRGASADDDARRA